MPWPHTGLYTGRDTHSGNKHEVWISEIAEYYVEKVENVEYWLENMGCEGYQLSSCDTQRLMEVIVWQETEIYLVWMQYNAITSSITLSNKHLQHIHQMFAVPGMNSVFVANLNIENDYSYNPLRYIV